MVPVEQSSGATPLSYAVPVRTRSHTRLMVVAALPLSLLLTTQAGARLSPDILSLIASDTWQFAMVVSLLVAAMLSLVVAASSKRVRWLAIVSFLLNGATVVQGCAIGFARSP